MRVLGYAARQGLHLPVVLTAGEPLLLLFQLLFLASTAAVVTVASVSAASSDTGTSLRIAARNASTLASICWCSSTCANSTAYATLLQVARIAIECAAGRSTLLQARQLLLLLLLLALETGW